jgi:hypothetical protein
MFGTSRCFARILFKLGGPDATFTVLLYPCPFRCLADFVPRNITLAKNLFADFCFLQFTSGPLIKAQNPGGNLTAQFAVITS